MRVAAASNFSRTLQDISIAFAAATGHSLKISTASTGKLYAQIVHGAPFDVFLAADESHVDKIIAAGLAEQKFSYIYALGKLAFVSNLKPERECRDVLYSDQLRYLAIANPSTAPYGVAALQIMQNLKVKQKLQAKLVMGENIVQTLQFVASTSADAGFVAMSLLVDNPRIKPACVWLVPNDLYEPIKQKMVVLTQAREKSAAMAFWRFMQSAQAAVIIRETGYDIF